MLAGGNMCVMIMVYTCERTTLGILEIVGQILSKFDREVLSGSMNHGGHRTGRAMGEDDSHNHRIPGGEAPEGPGT